MNDPKDLITDVSKELIKPVYDDLAHPAMMEGGKALGRIPRAINAAFSRLDKWILKKEYSIKETELLLEQKLQNIASEKSFLQSHMLPFQLCRPFHIQWTAQNFGTFMLIC
ncbi:hypothetical protein [Eubacterium sp.]|uniref:hypothetical protein n=1 Tax=Eubacterium sp. TaxID=142586 RepID=UPI0026DF75E4|nr:hypothetical protein [Eubacterium sp.]MDO5431553.1 hypothetical protein [Eubacterium sp.]